MSINPFRPTFGVTPPTLSGRDRMLGRFRSAMEAGPTHPDYTMLIVSPRGSGKTVLLSAMRQAAEEAGWVTVRATAASGDDFAGLLVEQMATAVRVCPDRGVKRRVESAHISVFGVGAGLSISSGATDVEPIVHTRMLRAMEALAGLAEELGVGALITIDEFPSRVETVEPAGCGASDPAGHLGDAHSARLLRDDLRLGFCSGAGPFRCTTLWQYDYRWHRPRRWFLRACSARARRGPPRILPARWFLRAWRVRALSHALWPRLARVKTVVPSSLLGRVCRYKTVYVQGFPAYRT